VRLLPGVLVAATALLGGCDTTPPTSPPNPSGVIGTPGPSAAAVSPAPGVADLTTRPLVWFAPLPPLRLGLPFADGSADYFDLFAPNASWTSAGGHVHVFTIYSSWVMNYATDEQLREVVESTRARGMALALEIGGLMPKDGCGMGVEGFDAGLEPIQKIEAAGGIVSLLSLDEVYAFGHVFTGPSACGWSVDRVAAEVASFVRTVKTAEPAMLVGDTEPLWSDVSPSDLGAWWDAYRQASGAPFDFVHLDADWTLGDWPDRAVAATAQARKRGIAATLIYNGGDRASSDLAWNEVARAHIDAYESGLGGRPDHLVFQSWMDRPDRVLPDSDPTTFTGLIRQYFAPRSVIALNPVDVDDGRLRISGSLRTAGGDPIAGGTIGLTATPIDGAYQVSGLNGRVPAGATKAVIGLRANIEGAGPGPVHLSVYELRYTQGTSRQNRVPDPRFAGGLARWPPGGSARVRVLASDHGSGRMLRIDATSKQSTLITSAEFRVTAGAAYRFSAAVRVPASSAGNAYVAVIFLNDTEVARERMELSPRPITLRRFATTTVSGEFVAAGLKLEPGRYRLSVTYLGDIDHWPSTTETSVTIK
jgi:hypothetical protein